MSFQVFCNHLAEEKRACDFTLTVFIRVLKFVLLSVLCLFLVVTWVGLWSLKWHFKALPRGVMGLSAICDCGIS